MKIQISLAKRIIVIIIICLSITTFSGCVATELGTTYRVEISTPYSEEKKEVKNITLYFPLPMRKGKIAIKDIRKCYKYCYNCVEDTYKTKAKDVVAEIINTKYGPMLKIYIPEIVSKPYCGALYRVNCDFTQAFPIKLFCPISLRGAFQITPSLEEEISKKWEKIDEGWRGGWRRKIYTFIYSQFEGESISINVGMSVSYVWVVWAFLLSAGGTTDLIYSSLPPRELIIKKQGWIKIPMWERHWQSATIETEIR